MTRATLKLWEERILGALDRVPLAVWAWGAIALIVGSAAYLVGMLLC